MDVGRISQVSRSDGAARKQSYNAPVKVVPGPSSTNLRIKVRPPKHGRCAYPPDIILAQLALQYDDIVARRCDSAYHIKSAIQSYGSDAAKGAFHVPHPSVDLSI